MQINSKQRIAKIRAQRNLNSLSQLITKREAQPSDVHWAIDLRRTIKFSLRRSEAQVPQVYYKETEANKLRREVKEDKLDMPKFHHLIMHRLIQPHAGQVAFESGLRSMSHDKVLMDKERGWSNLPNIKKRGVQFINRDSKNKVKGLETRDFESAYDGYLKFPQYEGRVRERNLADVKHLVKAQKQLPVLHWEMSLRDRSSLSHRDSLA